MNTFTSANTISFYKVITRFHRTSAFLLLFFFSTTSQQVSAQIGEVLWEDNFDTFSTNLWTIDLGDGCNQNLCGWGNQELQSYEENNVYISEIPNEPGNKALVLEAKRENSGTRAYTSGKVITEDKVAIQYGMIEARVQVPNLEQGLWPAVWMLGTAKISWPSKGEIDIMEMGFSKEGRDFQGETTATVNTYVGANAFFPTPNNGVGNIAFDVDFNKPYVAATPLNDRFVIYRIYWEPTQIRFTVIDNAVEYDLYEAPFPIDAQNPVTAPFTKPFYMILNLAVGGTLPGTLTNESISATLPGKMYIDYVKVSKWNGHGSVTFSDGSLPEEEQVFGVYTDTTPTTNKFTLGSDAEFYVFEQTLTASNGTALEGDNVLSLTTDPTKGWFGAGISSLFGKNMSKYVEKGVLKFNIKIPADVSFIIGVNDNFTNAAELSFPAGQTTYGLVRNGEWGQVTIPIKDFAGLIAFQDMSYLFRIGSDGTIPDAPFEILIDDIVWLENAENPIDCDPDAIQGLYKINTTPLQGGIAVAADSGDMITLAPEGNTGNWSWHGPNNFSSDQRELVLNNISPSDSGIYKATLTNNCNAKSTINFYLTIDGILSVCCDITPENRAESTLKIYPNPFRETIAIASSETIDKIEWYDVTGKLLSEDISVIKTNEGMQYQMNALQKGVYIFIAYLESGEKRIHQAVKN